MSLSNNRYKRCIDTYLSKNKSELDAKCKYYKNLPNIKIALEYATKALMNGHKLDHQYRIKNVVLKEMADKLLLKIDEIDKAEDFEQIFNIISKEKISGFGDLCIYDTSLRIGAYLNLEPQKVYLQAGTKKGANNLGIPTKKKRFIEIDELPILFKDSVLSKTLTPKHIEDLLCIYKKRF